MRSTPIAKGAAEFDGNHRLSSTILHQRQSRFTRTITRTHQKRIANLSVPHEAPVAIALPSNNAFESLLRFTLTTMQVSRGSLSIGDIGNASLKAQIGFVDPDSASTFADGGDADLTSIPLDEHGVLKAIIALERRPRVTQLPLPAAMIELLRAQIPVLLEADCLTIGLAGFRANISSIIDDAPEPFISIDASGVVREWNEAAASTFGWSRAEALGMTVAELIVPPELRAQHRRGFERYRPGLLSRIVGQRVTQPALCRDGTRIVIEMRVSSSADSDGQLTYHAFIHDVTELETTRELLSRSEHLLTQAQQIVALGSYEHDLRTDEVFCSEEIYRIVQIEAGEPYIPIARIREFVHPDDALAVHTEYTLAIQEKRSHDFEHRMVRPSGEVITVRRRGYVVTDDEGRAIRVYATIHDVTNQRRTEAERRDLESRFTEAFENAPVGMSIITAQALNFGTFTRVNHAYCSLLGYSQDEIVGKNFTTFIVPDDRTSAVETTRELLRGQVSVTKGELRMICHDRTVIWVRQTHSLMRDERGDALHFFTNTEDVTQLRMDQAALAEVNTRLRRSLEDAPIGMALTSTAPLSMGRFIEVNPALCRITGYDRNALSGMTFDELIHPDGRSHRAGLMRKLLCGEETVSTYEERYVRANGTHGWMSVHASIAYDDVSRPMYCIKQVVDITKRKEAEIKLEYLAYHDALTGVLNRRGLSLEVKRRFIDADLAVGQTALLLLDLDHFKYVNDTMGYAAGDRILRKVTKLLRKTCERDAIIARLGGDEFLVIFTGSTEKAAISKADDIRAIIQAQILFSRESQIRATGSIGIAMVDAWTLRTIDDAIAAADTALATAKTQGRNRSSVAQSLISSHTVMREQLTWTQRIRLALERNDFRLYAQPILNLRSGKIERYELLVRMIEADGSIRFPSEFLGVAERAGLMPEIDCWVVRRAIDIAATQHRSGSPIVFELNLSGASLTNESVARCIEEELRSTAIDPGALVFEITETAAIENMDQACNFARKIYALGCAFALDDFGAGFSSFYYLKYLPFNDLKIDGEFIRNLTKNVSDQHIVRAIVELARGLGKTTIAEFVGDADTALLLQQYGVDFAQGFYIGKPLPWEAIPKTTSSIPVTI